MEVVGSEVGEFFFPLWLIMTAGTIVGWIILLVVIWRAMKAQESIAETLKHIAQK